MQRSTYVVRTTGITDTRDDARSLHGTGEHSHCFAGQGCNSMTTIYNSSLISWLEECHTVSMACGTADRRITVALGCKIYNALICMMLTHRFWWSGYIYTKRDKRYKFIQCVKTLFPFTAATFHHSQYYIHLHSLNPIKIEHDCFLYCEVT